MARIVLMSIVGLLALQAWAGEHRCSLDPAASRVAFTLNATLHRVEGSFRVQSGELSFDSATGEISGRIVVDARSGDTANAKRDAKMHGAVLESERFPEIVFEPVSFAGNIASAGQSRIEVRGDFAVHGARHRLVVPVELSIEGERVRAVATFSVPYVEWGLEDPSAFVLRVGEVVAVTAELVGTLQAR